MSAKKQTNIVTKIHLSPNLVRTWSRVVFSTKLVSFQTLSRNLKKWFSFLENGGKIQVKGKCFNVYSDYCGKWESQGVKQLFCYCQGDNCNVDEKCNCWKYRTVFNQSVHKTIIWYNQRWLKVICIHAGLSLMCEIPKGNHFRSTTKVNKSLNVNYFIIAFLRCNTLVVILVNCI